MEAVGGTLYIGSAGEGKERGGLAGWLEAVQAALRGCCSAVAVGNTTKTKSAKTSTMERVAPVFFFPFMREL